MKYNMFCLIDVHHYMYTCVCTLLYLKLKLYLQLYFQRKAASNIDTCKKNTKKKSLRETVTLAQNVLSTTDNFCTRSSTFI